MQLRDKQSDGASLALIVKSYGPKGQSLRPFKRETPGYSWCFLVVLSRGDYSRYFLALARSAARQLTRHLAIGLLLH